MSVSRNIWSTDSYVYRATTSGVAIYDITTEALIDFATVSGGANSVWANDHYLYVASNNGILRSSTSGTINLSTYKVFPDITSNIVYYVHGASDYVCAATLSGVDRYTISTSARSYTSTTNAHKCFQASNGDYYYVTNSEMPTISGLDKNIFEWEYGRVVNLASPTTVDNCPFYFEIPNTQPDEIYTKASSEDVRIIDDQGRVRPYYIETWDNVSNPGIWVKLYSGTSKFYVLYGNTSVSAVSNIMNLYEVYDNFDGTTLSSQFEFDNGGYSQSTATIVNNALRIYTRYHTAPIFLRTVANIPENFILETSFKKVLYSDSYPTNIDITFGAEGGVYSSIGDSVNPPHTVYNTASGTIVGTEYLDTAWKDYTLIVNSDYQASNFNGDILAVSGTVATLDTNFYLTYANLYYEPLLYIDYIKIRVYDYNAPSYTISSHTSINNLMDYDELYGVYNTIGSYNYTTGRDEVIPAQKINDIHITEGTSEYNNDNVIFLGTSYGGIVIEEKRGDEANLRKRIYLLET